MPVMDGYEATRRIKASSAGKETVIVALTASAFEEDRLEALEQGCDDFVRKPYMEAEILDVLKNYLGVRYVHQDNNWPTIDDAQENILPDEELIVILSEMPADLIDNFKEVIEMSDYEKINEMLKEISNWKRQTADGLYPLINNFEPSSDSV